MNTSLYTKVRSLHEAYIDPKDLCIAIKKMGGKGAAITDRAVVSSIEDYRRAFAAEELKLVPGCEILTDRGSLVLLAVNDNGWHGISKIVTRSNTGLKKDEDPIISINDMGKIAMKYKGDIICLSGNTDGVLYNALRAGELTQIKIDELKGEQEKYRAPFDPAVQEAEDAVVLCREAYEKAILDRDENKRIAEQKFSSREKAISKLKGADAEEASKQLEKDKKAAEEAAKLIDTKKDAVTSAKKALSAAEKALKTINTSVDEYLSLEEEISKLEGQTNSDKSVNLVEAFKKVFGEDCFYIQLMYHGTEIEKNYLPSILELARKTSTKICAANEVCMAEGSADERLKRQIIRSLKDGKRFESEKEGDSERYLKSDEQIKKMLIKVIPSDAADEALANTESIFDRCNVEFNVGKHYPKFSQTENADDILDREIEKGIAWRYPDGMDEEHKARLEYEVGIIKSMGYSDYHLVVKDFLEYGRLLGYVPTDRIEDAPLTISELEDYIHENGWKNRGMMIGPGRGSAVGSLVCYLLGITALDPIKYNLLFERFLNPERVSMPDIDSDIANRTRDKVIQYVKNRYGEMAVCGIMTTNAQAAKGCIRIAAKFFGLKNYGEPLTALGNQIAKEMPDDKTVKVTFATKVDENGKLSTEEDAKSLLEYLKELHKNELDALEIIRWATIIEGTFTAYGAHAAGIVISDNADVSDYLPLRWNDKMGMFTTQCDMIQVEDNGLLKFDFLGLKTLDIITETLRLIERQTGNIIDPLTIPMDDEDVYRDILAAGKTNSIFQFESDGMKAMLKRFRPENFEDLIILVSMFRPGPLQYLDGVIDVKQGRRPLSYITPEMEPIVGKTYGAIVYQEQVMEIFQKLAGFSLGGADMVRRAMGKKKLEKLMHEKEAFINGDESRGIKGCVANGISAEIANELFDQMTDFASYAFNKSHAAAYAYNAYITAWLKCHYPAEFFASALNWAADKDEISKLMYDAAAFGVTIKAPDINLSDKDFTVENNAGKKIVRFGLGSVASVKDQADDIISERYRGDYKSVKDFYRRVRPNSRVVNNLIAAGAFDAFSGNREELKAIVEGIQESVKNLEKKLSFIRSAEYVLPLIDSMSSDEDVVKAQTEAGLKAEVTKKITVDALVKRIDTAKAAVKNLNDDIALVNPHGIAEDKKARMAAEKELLGMYVTEHPMNYYPSAKEVEAPTVSEIQEGRSYAYGCVTGLKIKNRKSDGAKMAFFTLEDATGSIETCVFTKAYASYGEVLKEGAVVKMFGRCIMEEDGDEIVYKFSADKIEEVDEKKASAIMYVSSYASYHLDVEEDIKSVYGKDRGIKLYIHDAAMDEIRTANYCVSEAIFDLPNVEEIIL